jgi:WXG100 family type VII secretion target
MADRILMTPQELNDGSQFLLQKLSTLQSEVQQLNQRVRDIESRWEGASKQAFIQRYESELYPVLEKVMPDVINALAQKLDAAANAIRDTDQQIASAFRG